MQTLETIQRLPISLEQAWDFFSCPGNLKDITPPHMTFKILSGFKEGEKMHAGMIISYLLKPLPGVPMKCVTEITHVNAPHFFVDEQRFGPYALWHHQHFFKEIEGGVEMKDIVHYKTPLGPIGQIANLLYINREVRSIFDYRFKKLETLFGKWEDRQR